MLSHTYTLTQGELTSCKDDLEEHLREVETSKTQFSIREQAELDLRAEIDTLKSELSRLATSEESFQTKLATKERKIEFLEEKIGELQVGRSQKLDAVSLLEFVPGSLTYMYINIHVTFSYSTKSNSMLNLFVTLLLR